MDLHSILARIETFDSLEVFYATVAACVVACLVIVWSLQSACQMFHDMWLEGGVKQYVFRRVFRTAKNLPIVKGKVRAFADKFRADFRRDVLAKRQEEIFTLPAEPLGDERILKRCKEQGEKAKATVKQGKISGCVFTADEKHFETVNEAMRLNSSANPLFFNDFHFAMQCEAEVVKMTLDLYHGPPDSCGILSQGGTDSIFLATNAYREQGREVRGISVPNVVASESAHVAIDKACHYLGIELRKVPVLSGSLECDVRGIRRCVDGNTLFIYASCPDFAHGNHDPTEQLSDLAVRYGCGMHVDSCMGGFINPFLADAGFPPSQPFDFRLKGVTTISCDNHKYGYAPKGASVCMFRTRELRNLGIFTQTTWNGGLYTTTGSAGSRNGSIAVGAWAAMLRLGRKGYVEKCQRIVDSTLKLRKALAKIPELRVLSRDVSTCVCVTSDIYNPVALGEYLYRQHGWSIIKVQKPLGFHFTVTDASYHIWELFAQHVEEAVEAFRKDPLLNSSETAAIYGYAASIPDSSFMGQFLRIAMEEIEDTHEKTTD